MINASSGLGKSRQLSLIPADLFSLEVECLVRAPSLFSLVPFSTGLRATVTVSYELHFDGLLQYIPIQLTAMFAVVESSIQTNHL